jgi:hypothetical protein
VSKEESIDVLEIPAGTVFVRHFGAFISSAAFYWLLNHFWGEYVLMKLSDLNKPFSLAGITQVWFIFAWVLALSLVQSPVHYWEDKLALTGRAIWLSLNAGFWEELIYRWLAFFWAMIMLPFFDWITFGFVHWCFQTIFIPVTNWLTLGAFTPQMTAPNWVLGGAIISATASFRNAHASHGIFGWANSWFIGMVFFWLVLHYGLATAIVAHILYDLIALGMRVARSR